MSQLAYRWLWLQGMLLVLAARLLVRVDAAAALQRSMARSLAGREPTTAAEWQQVMRIGHATATGGAWVVDRKRPCLPIALATQGLLARLGFRAVVRLGVGRSGNTIEAHAWVECGGRCIVGKPEQTLVALH